MSASPKAATGRSRSRRRKRPDKPVTDAAGYSLRAGDLADLAAVYRLNCEAFAESWSKASLHAALESGFDLFVCEDHGVLAGYILSQDILDEVHIMQVAVDRRHRRRGVARALSRFLLRQKQAMLAVLLEVRASNRAAQSLYQELGFRRCGLRKNYYSPDAAGVREDAVLMRLDLAAPRPLTANGADGAG